MGIDLAARPFPRGADAADDELAELLPVNLEQCPERCVRRVRAAMCLAPRPVFLKKPPKDRAIDAIPAPFGRECRDRLRRPGKDRLRIVTGRVRRPEPVPRYDAEIPGAAAGVRPPEVVVRVSGV